LLLQHRTEQTISSHAINEVPQAVVTANDVPFPNAANGVIAENIHGLLAERTGETRLNNREAEAVQDGSAEDARGQNRIATIFIGRSGGEEAVGVRLGASQQTLVLAIIRSGS
jgi:hypothetical protein